MSDWIYVTGTQPPLAEHHRGRLHALLVCCDRAVAADEAASFRRMGYRATVRQRDIRADGAHLTVHVVVVRTRPAPAEGAA